MKVFETGEYFKKIIIPISDILWVKYCGNLIDVSQEQS